MPDAPRQDKRIAEYGQHGQHRYRVARSRAVGRGSGQARAAGLASAVQREGAVGTTRTAGRRLRATCARRGWSRRSARRRRYRARDGRRPTTRARRSDADRCRTLPRRSSPAVARPRESPGTARRSTRRRPRRAGLAAFTRNPPMTRLRGQRRWRRTVDHAPPDGLEQRGRLDRLLDELRAVAAGLELHQRLVVAGHDDDRGVRRLLDAPS